MGISINNGENSIVIINEVNQTIFINEKQENISVNGIDGYHIIMIIFFSIILISASVFFYKLFKELNWIDSSDISHEIDEENLKTISVIKGA